MFGIKTILSKAKSIAVGVAVAEVKSKIPAGILTTEKQLSATTSSVDPVLVAAIIEALKAKGIDTTPKA